MHMPQEPTKPTMQPQPIAKKEIAPVGTPDTGDISVSGLLAELEGRGVVVTLKGNQVSCRTRAALADDLRFRIRAQTPAIIRALAPKPRPVCAVRSRWSSISPRTMTLVRHNRTGQNRYGQDAENHPYALINMVAWNEADWNLADCRWYRSKEEAVNGATSDGQPSGAGQEERAA
jgi:hypothetical protein